jgi:hypothetical protein
VSGGVMRASRQRTSYRNRPPVEKHCYGVTVYMLQSLLLLVSSADAYAAATAAAAGTTTTLHYATTNTITTITTTVKSKDR